MSRAASGGPDGLLVVDKPAGMTSHDVVARVRRIAGTRKVGHAGTLDPMATGVLVLGLGKATRLLGHLALRDKDYLATIRLGVATSTDDADGEVVSTSDRPWTVEAVRAAMAGLTGEIDQVPSSVSAIKIGGERAYALARRGESPALAARRVTVTSFDLLDDRPPDLDVRVTCSTGTYVRALARDLGAALGVGGHLTALRRTRVGVFTEMRTLAEIEADLGLTPLADAVTAAFPRRDLDADEARIVSHGGWLPAIGIDGPAGCFGPDGTVLALLEERDGKARPLCVFAP